MERKPKEIYYENAANTVIANLKKRQMEGYYCPDCQTAVKKVLELIPEGSSIGWGGAMSLEESGLMKALKEGNYRLIDRALAKSPKESKEIFAQIFGADFFLMSTNAITLDGVLVNMDGRANRVSFLCYGPEHVIILAGVNKIAPDLDSAIKRVRNVASPANAVRLQRKTPCAITGKCADCQAPDCICSQLVITRRSQVKGRIQVVLVGEELGY